MFEVGRPVTGESFIGRESYIRSIVKYMEFKKSISIVGIARIGKSSIVDETIRRIQNGTIRFEDEIPLFFKYSFTRDRKDMFHLFRELYSFLKSHLVGSELENDSIIQKKKAQIEDDLINKDVSFIPYVSICNEIYSKTKHSIWLVLEDMDYANESLGVYIDKIRELINSSKDSVRSINISRHSLASIFPLGTPGSNYPGIISEIINVVGFEEQDLSEFRTRSKIYLEEIDNDTWESIRYYTGNIPVLLGTFLNEVIKHGGFPYSMYIGDIKDRIDDYFKLWINSLYDMNTINALRDFLEQKPSNYKLLRNCGLVDNDKLVIPYLQEYFIENNVSRSTTLLNDFLNLLSDIDLLLDSCKSASVSLFGFDDYNRKKVQKGINDLNAMKLKVEYYQKIHALNSFVDMELTLSEYNSFVERMNEIHHLIGGLGHH